MVFGWTFHFAFVLRHLRLILLIVSDSDDRNSIFRVSRNHFITLEDL